MWTRRAAELLDALDDVVINRLASASPTWLAGSRSETCTVARALHMSHDRVHRAKTVLAGGDELHDTESSPQLGI